MRPTELIDAAFHDHAEMHAVLERLRAAVGSTDRELAHSLLGQLLMIEARHYATEEALMRAVAYADADEHRREHAAMLDTLTRIVETVALENLASISPQIVAHLESALAHMMDTDHRLNRFASASAR